MYKWYLLTQNGKFKSLLGGGGCDAASVSRHQLQRYKCCHTRDFTAQSSFWAVGRYFLLKLGYFESDPLTLKILLIIFHSLSRVW